MIVHIFACLQISFLDYGISWAVENGINNESMFTLYIRAFSHCIVSISTVGYSNKLNTSYIEVFDSFMLVVIGSLYYSTFISVVSNYID